MGQAIRIWAALFLIASLSACTTIQLEPLPEGMTDQPPADWLERSSKLKRFDHWQLSGKLAVRQPSDSGTAIINYWIRRLRRSLRSRLVVVIPRNGQHESERRAGVH